MRLSFVSYKFCNVRTDRPDEADLSSVFLPKKMKYYTKEVLEWRLYFFLLYSALGLPSQELLPNISCALWKHFCRLSPPTRLFPAWRALLLRCLDRLELCPSVPTARFLSILSSNGDHYLLHDIASHYFWDIITLPFAKHYFLLWKAFLAFIPFSPNSALCTP